MILTVTNLSRLTYWHLAIHARSGTITIRPIARKLASKTLLSTSRVMKGARNNAPIKIAMGISRIAFLIHDPSQMSRTQMSRIQMMIANV